MKTLRPEEMNIVPEFRLSIFRFFMILFLWILDGKTGHGHGQAASVGTAGRAFISA